MNTATPVMHAAAAARARIRAGDHRGQTSGLAPGFVQGNLVILPEADAHDFLRYATANPKPCPVLAVSDAGNPHLPALGAIDIRTDLPLYHVFRNGALEAEVPDIRAQWRDDLVAFVLGCSFSFEEAITAEGIEVRHIARGCGVSMYRTSIPTVTAGRFSGPLVVSMRPFRPAEAIRVIQITSRFPTVHGAPVHIGLPEAIGIRDLGAPDYGEAVEIRPGELPVFWACGVTPQAAIAASKPAFAITHAPSCMLITDLVNAKLAVL